MMKGIENIFKTGVEIGGQITGNSQQTPKDIEVSSVLSLEDEKSDK